jgi:hypothetical protein
VNCVERAARAIGGLLEATFALMPQQLLRASIDRDYVRGLNRLDDPDDGGEALDPYDDRLFRWTHR